ncbi:MAG TPA: hypothetical protein VMS17_33715 [Gemmataceae bacterium]|nr:hypothetical protein [Gemmataceae bacterium]
MRDRFSVQFPKKYDPADASTVVGSRVVIAWGDYDQKQARQGEVFGLLLAIEPGAANPVVVQGVTLNIHPDLWVVVFQPVVQASNNYVMEIWKLKNAGGGGKVRDKVLCRWGPISVQPPVWGGPGGGGGVTLTTPPSNSQVYPCFIAGGDDNDYAAGTFTFTYGANSCQPNISPGSGGNPYWIAAITLTGIQAPVPGCSGVMNNIVPHNTNTDTGITVIPNPPPPPPQAGPGDG